MKTILPVNLADLLHCRTVESERVEFKRSWDPKTTGLQVLRTICAFANDHHNLNGGYVVIGVEERDGRAVLPPLGLAPETAEAAEKWIRGNCRRIDPDYQPMLSREWVGDRLILVVWAFASQVRPHQAPDGKGQRRYWVRVGSETVDAEHGGLLQPLIQQTGRVPWDDRRAMDARIENLRESRVRQFLHDVESGLFDEPEVETVYRGMRLTTKVNDHDVPRNVGLLLFSTDPTEWFRGAWIEVVQFAADRGGDVQEERVFKGGLLDQFHDCMTYLENLSVNHLQKRNHRRRVRGWVNFPVPAIREALVNALYHRSYDVPHPDPTKVYLFPDRVEIISYPGPVPGVRSEHLVPGSTFHGAPARNRRIGEFFKELRLAEMRLTGLPKMYRAMEANGSPPPRFRFDESRTYFQVTLPAHPEYVALSALRDAAHLRVLGDEEEAFRRVEVVWKRNQASRALAVELIRAYAKKGETARAEDVFRAFEAQGPAVTVPHVANVLAEVLVAAGDPERARQLLQEDDEGRNGQDAIDAAIVARRARDSQLAHQHFERAGEAVHADPRALLEFAQTKLWLAGEALRSGVPESNRRLLAEARTLLERVLQLNASPARHAWAWRELARTLNWLGAPRRQAEAAYQRAIALLPSEQRFQKELDRLREQTP